MKCPLKFARYEFEGGTECIGAECGFYGAVCRNDALPPDSDVSATDVDANDANAAQDMDMSVSVHKCPNELPEGDVVAIMRKAAKGFQGGTGNVMKNAKMLLDMNIERGLDSVLLETLADMIERDYVRRDDYDFTVEMLNCMKAERDDLQAKVDELTAERDKLQRERNVAISRASYMESAAAEELAKLLEENDTIEVYDDKIHGKRRLVTGTQRKLEKQVAELTEQLEAAHAKNRALKAHISKMQSGRHGWHIKGVELQRKVDELTAQLRASNAERERLRECLGIATDNAHDLLTLVDESGNVYDRDEGLA